MKMKSTLKKVDCIIELHDARIPFSGRNPILKSSMSTKPRVVVLNKVDLVNVSHFFLLVYVENYICIFNIS